jgi:hypothetical protein
MKTKPLKFTLKTSFFLSLHQQQKMSTKKRVREADMADLMESVGERWKERNVALSNLVRQLTAKVEQQTQDYEKLKSELVACKDRLHAREEELVETEVARKEMESNAARLYEELVTEKQKRENVSGATMDFADYFAHLAKSFQEAEAMMERIGEMAK